MEPTGSNGSLLIDVADPYTWRTAVTLQRVLPRRRCSDNEDAALRGGGRVAEYLTDGTRLYRFIDWGLSGDFAELEDCLSLELVLVARRELRARRLRAVLPAPAP